MTNTDKTRQKLVNSMRKSKDTAASGSVPKTGTATKRSPSKAPAKSTKKAAAKTGTKSVQRSAASAKTIATTGSRRVSVDSYQQGLRVWPD